MERLDLRLKVHHVIGGGEFGGAEVHIIQLLTLLKDQGVEGKVICFYEADLSKALREKGIPVEVLQFGRFDFRLRSALKELFRRDRPDVIHTHGVKANFFARHAAKGVTDASGRRIPLVTTVHSLLRFDYPNKLAYSFAALMEKSSRKLNQHYIAISQAIKSSLEEDGISSRKITVVHHGIDYARYSEGRPFIRELLNLSDDVYLIGAVTRLVHNKGLNYLLEAMPRVIQGKPHAHLAIAGSGPEEQALQSRAKQLGIAEHVHWLGFRKEVEDCLQSFDCFVSPSLSEGLGLNVMEAMAARLPVVVTNVGGIVDFTVDGVNGLLVQPAASDRLAERILEVALDPELARRLGEEAQRRVREQFTLDRMTQGTIGVYEQLREGRQGHG